MDGVQQANQAIETWHVIGGSIGSVLASLFGMWAAFMRPMRRQVEEAKAAPTQRMALYEAEQTRMLERLKKVEDKADKAVTGEEFAAHAGTTTGQLQNMTEKVGVLTGMMKAKSSG